MSPLRSLLVVLVGLLTGICLALGLNSGRKAASSPQARVATGSVAAMPVLQYNSSEDSEKVEQQLKQVLQSQERLRAENHSLRRQLAETNRDLAELQFQVDSHSESFRPLRAAPTPAESPQPSFNPGLLLPPP